jgi:hypothetical protein
MPINIKCPSCSTPMAAPDQMAGQMVRCPKCNTTLQVPAASAATNSAPTTAAPGKMPSGAPAGAGPQPAAKSRRGLYIGAGVGALVLLLSCCVLSVAGYFILPSLMAEKNEKVTKENFDKLKADMTQKDALTQKDLEDVLGPGKPTTLDDVKAAYKNEKQDALDQRNAEHAVMIARKADYRWRNGDEFIFAIFNGPAKDNAKVVFLAYVNPVSGKTIESSHGTLSKLTPAAP